MGLQLELIFIIQMESSNPLDTTLRNYRAHQFNPGNGGGNNYYITMFAKQFIADLEINILLMLSIKQS